MIRTHTLVLSYESNEEHNAIIACGVAPKGASHGEAIEISRALEDRIFKRCLENDGGDYTDVLMEMLEDGTLNASEALLVMYYGFKRMSGSAFARSVLSTSLSDTLRRLSDE